MPTRPVSALHPASERDPILDALRGFAVLGILLVNIEVMRGSDWLVLMAGEAVGPPDRSDAVVQFAVGWLATGKFISSLAILFGLGAALIARRASVGSGSIRMPLARRYLCLAAFGLAHMLIFPDDILFLYGLPGLSLLAFVSLGVRALLAWAAAILIVFSALGARYLSAPEGSGEAGEIANEPDGFGDLASALREQSMAAFASGSLSDIVAAQASQAFLLQTAQLLVLPWILALFLFGFAIARAGVLNGIAARTSLLRLGAWIGLGAGLPANLGLGFFGALAGFGARPAEGPQWLTSWADFGQLLGAPVLAVGYLCALALFFLTRKAPPALVAVGRMALTAYLLQSVVALAVFGGLRLYDRLSSTSALLVVCAIWVLLLVVCPLWLRWFRFGPAEWLWRSLTYGERQPLRNS
ncbi:MAG: DUF418 domain-containing protein [Burkholderiales bacterium]